MKKILLNILSVKKNIKKQMLNVFAFNNDKKLESVYLYEYILVFQFIFKSQY